MDVMLPASLVVVAIVCGVVALVAAGRVRARSRATRRADAARRAQQEAADEEWVIRPVANAPVTLASFYAVDHDDIDRILEHFRAANARREPGAVATYREFKARLERHIGWEEDILFPLFERLSGLRDNGPTVVMRSEHRTIRTLLDAIDAALRHGTSIEADESALLAALATHNMKEENILYPLIDRQVSAADRDAVFARMRAETDGGWPAAGVDTAGR
jgi:iron-sulfur cluster repair protein YtfE (RIC family)